MASEDSKWTSSASTNDDSVAISGWLFKWTNVLKGYKKRWFRLQNTFLSYYRNSNFVGVECRGTLDLTNARILAPPGQSSFILTDSSGRKHHLKALSNSDKDRWLKEFSTVILDEELSGLHNDLYWDSSSIDSTYNRKQPAAGNSRPHRSFRVRLRDRFKLISRQSSSSNFPNESVSSNISHRLHNFEPPNPHSNTCFDKIQNPPDLKTDFGDEQSVTTSKSFTSFNSPLSDQFRPLSQVLDPNPVMELLSTIDTVKRRLEIHTNSVLTQISTLESVLSKLTMCDHALTDGSTNLETNDDFTQPNSSSEQQYNRTSSSLACILPTSRLALIEHRRRVEEFQKTCLEALQLLGNNFDHWYQRFTTEQEQRVRLERTVEQLARQHRSLERKLGQCYPSQFLQSSLDGIRTQHSTLKRLSTMRSSNSVYVDALNSDEEADIFFDANSFGSQSLFQEKVGDVKRPLLEAYSEALRASSTSLDCLKNIEESSSDSDLDTPTLLKKPPKVLSEEIEVAQKTSLQLDASHPRRTKIPRPPKVALNLWSIIKNGIGKDLTRFPLPVNFNEPLSFLQRAIEDFSYTHLLDKAAVCKDPAEQMAYVAAFSVSCYATTAVRTAKPFNPLLGETFEFDRTSDEYGWRLIAEQVTHHPPGSAVHCESSRFGWKVWFDFVLQSKFRGSHMSVFPQGYVKLMFEDGSYYTWNKATTVIHNLIVGSLWIDNCGDVTIHNHTNGFMCSLRYVPHSYFNRAPSRQVIGKVLDASGKPVRLVNGTWDRSMETQRLSVDDEQLMGSVQILWEADSPVPEANEMYNFTRFAIELNEPEPNVAPTDSRLRPDQRLMENGYWEQANEEKRRLEHKQRTKRFEWEQEHAAGIIHEKPLYTPLWFTSQRDSFTNEVNSVYLGNYWRAKAEQDWKNCPDIF